MKRMHDNSRVTEFFIRAGLVAALAAVALLPTTVKVHGSDALVEEGWPMSKRDSRKALPLPPIPDLERMPWLVQKRPSPKDLRIDTLFAPRHEMAPAVGIKADDGTPSPALGYSRRG